MFNGVVFNLLYVGTTDTFGSQIRIPNISHVCLPEGACQLELRLVSKKGGADSKII